MHDLATAANEELLSEGIICAFTPSETAPLSIPRLDVWEIATSQQLAIMFAPPLEIPNPMEVIEFDDELGSVTTAPVLARLAVKAHGSVNFVRLGGEEHEVQGGVLNCTAACNILSYLGDEVTIAPIYGEFDSEMYRAADEVVASLTCYPALTELAQSLL